MIYGMVQIKVPENLVHSIVMGAMEAVRKLICEALQCDLREPISRDEGLHTKVACVIYGMVQNKLQANLVPSNMKGVVKAERNFISEALQCDLTEPTSRDEGLHTDVARMI